MASYAKAAESLLATAQKKQMSLSAWLCELLASQKVEVIELSN
jgi:hypothetical protein